MDHRNKLEKEREADINKARKQHEAEIKPKKKIIEKT